MPNPTPDDLARGLKWADTIETDPVAKDLLASLVVLNARELLELAALGMRADPAREAEAGSEDSAGKQTPLAAELERLKKKLASIEAAANADAEDLAKMRDGTKLTRAGLVMTIQYLQEDLAALRLKWDELAKWKSTQQQALISMSVLLLESGYKGDCVVGGIKWLVAELAKARKGGG